MSNEKKNEKNTSLNFHPVRSVVHKCHLTDTNEWTFRGKLFYLPYFKQSKKFFNPCPFQPQRYKERDFGAILPPPPPSATPSIWRAILAFLGTKNFQMRRICPTSFPGSPILTPHRASEERPWHTLVTCHFDNWKLQGGVLCNQTNGHVAVGFVESEVSRCVATDITRDG